MGDNFIHIQKWLYPVSFLYGTGVRFRNKLFDWGILKSRNFDIPVISVGNITVGGTGKTPHTEYLIRLLKDRYRIAVLSRGYKRKSKGFVLAGADMPACVIGDEPYQMKHKFPEISVAVDKNRCHGIERLRSGDCGPKPDVVLLDDAFQHRYVKPGLNILLTDYHRLICNDALLPAGRLREAASQKRRANIVIVTKCPGEIKPVEFRVLTKQLGLFPYQKLFFTSFRYKELVPLFTSTGRSCINLENLGKDRNILLMTGIASPRQMLQDLKRYSRQIRTLSFGDHHDFTRKDLEELKARFDEMDGAGKLIVTTEKDAARLAGNPFLDDSLKPYLYVLPVEAYFLQNQEERFNKTVLAYIKEYFINHQKQ